MTSSGTEKQRSFPGYFCRVITCLMLTAAAPCFSASTSCSTRAVVGPEAMIMGFFSSTPAKSIPSSYSISGNSLMSSKPATSFPPTIPTSR